MSRDRHSTLIRIRVGDDSDIKPIVSIVERADKSPDFDVAITGEHTVGNDFGTLSQRDLEHGELFFGLPAALVVLVLVFGAVVAGLVPVLMALLSIVVGLGLVATALARVQPLGLHREHAERDGPRARDRLLAVRDLALPRGTDGRTPEGGGDRARRRDRQPGGAVQRRTFVVALFGMLLVPTNIMRSLAVGAIIVGVVSVAAALTLHAGAPERARRRRQRAAGARARPQPRATGRHGEPLLARDRQHGRPPARAQPALSVAGLMLAAAVPLFGLHIGASGVTSLPNDLPSKHGYLALQRAFPAQSPYPVEIVVQGGSNGVASGSHDLAYKLARDPRFGPGRIQVSPIARPAPDRAGARRPGRRPGDLGRPRPARARDPGDVRRHGRTGARRRQDGGERRVLRRRHEPDALRARSSCSASA